MTTGNEIKGMANKNNNKFFNNPKGIRSYFLNSVETLNAGHIYVNMFNIRGVTYVFFFFQMRRFLLTLDTIDKLNLIYLLCK